MDDDDPPREVDKPATSAKPAPHPEPAPTAAAQAPTATGEASEATAPLEHTSTTCTPAQASRMAQLAAEAHRLRRPPRRTTPLQLSQYDHFLNEARGSASYAAAVRETWGRLHAATPRHLSDADARVMELEAEAASGSQNELTAFLDPDNNSRL
eukprot:jgi/Tetstr1/427525/TSEL_017651.t1